MPDPHFEVAAGPIDGSNVNFSVTMPYLASTLVVWLNGQLKRRDWDDGWIELSPLGGTFQMKVPPKLLDIVQAFYLDRTLPGPETEITGITGTIRPLSTLGARVADTQPIKAGLSVVAMKTTLHIPFGELRATIRPSAALKGVVAPCCECDGGP